MRVYCTYSGVSFLAEGFTNKMNINGKHPIFDAPLRSLLNRSGDWAAGRLSEVERKLLFLALLNSTKLVHFHAPAQPSDSVVQGNMEHLLRFIAWYSDIHSAQLKLPQFVIDHTTARMANVNVWIQTWWQRKKDWENGFEIQTRRERLATREAALYRLINSVTKNSENYAGTLASWALDASNAPKALHEYWTKLFKLKGLEIYKAELKDLEELLEHLEDNLPIYDTSIYSNAVLTHVRKLVLKNKAGLNYGLGIPDEQLAEMDLAAMAANPFRIVEETVETANKESIASIAPVDEPKPENYKTRFLYLRAKAAWQIAAKQAESSAMLEAENKKLEQMDALLNEEDNDDEDIEGQINIIRENDNE